MYIPRMPATTLKVGDVHGGSPDYRARVLDVRKASRGCVQITDVGVGGGPENHGKRVTWLARPDHDAYHVQRKG